MGISTTCRNYFFLYSFLLSVLEGEGGGGGDSVCGVGECELRANE